MDVKELRDALERIESLYDAAGASAAAKSVRSVARLLDGYDGKSVDHFIAETKELLGKPAASHGAAVNQDCVVEHGDRLLAAGIDQAAFDQAMSELESDRRVGKLEWAAIANRYRNRPTGGAYVFKFKSIKEAREAIRDTFIERHEAHSKRKIIDRITKWAS